MSLVGRIDRLRSSALPLLRADWPAWAVLLALVLVLALLHNLAFAHAVASSLPQPFGAQEWRIAGSAFLALIGLLVVCLVPISAPRTIKPAAVVLLLVSAVCSYFMDSFGAVIDRSMLVNVANTDTHEAGDLLHGAFWWHVLLTGVLPALVFSRLRIRPERLFPALRQRALISLGSVMLLLAVALPQYNALSFWGREHREVRLLVNPTYPLYSAWRFAKGLLPQGPARPLKATAPDAARAVPVATSRPLLVVLVLGETARAQNFQLDGYERATNPQLSQITDLINFADARSCGTATAESVPCMFSGLGRAHFRRERAQAQENVLDVLARTGVQVQWWDNDSGCQGVCKRLPSRTLEKDPDPAFCSDGQCHDGVLLRDLDQALPAAGQAGLLVLHTKGSHGPAYFKRYPDSARHFQPDCRDENVQRCSQEQIVNAYDNTLVYTDALLAQAIERLRGASAQLDSVLIYVSDHGESLGENGVYLHGLPYAIAPEQQTRVPLMAWMSPGARSRLGIDPACAMQAAARSVSHDHLFHSLLGLFSVRTRAYDPGLDLFGACHRGGSSGTRVAAATG